MLVLWAEVSQIGLDFESITIQSSNFAALFGYLVFFSDVDLDFVIF